MEIDSNENPYAPPSEIAVRGQLSLYVPLLGIVAIAIVVAGWVTFGVLGIAPAIGLVAIAWYGVSRHSSPRLWPVNCWRITLVELLVVIAICGILEGLLLPSVRTHGRPRPSGVAPLLDSQTTVLEAGEEQQ